MFPICLQIPFFSPHTNAHTHIHAHVHKHTHTQTYIGSILSAVNPYKVIDGLYCTELMEQYMNKQLGEMPPHIYAIANEVYTCMWRMSQNQCVLIRSGHTH